VVVKKAFLFSWRNSVTSVAVAAAEKVNNAFDFQEVSIRENRSAGFFCCLKPTIFHYNPLEY
jgi:hypothetical protein